MPKRKTVKACKEAFDEPEIFKRPEQPRNPTRKKQRTGVVLNETYQDLPDLIPVQPLRGYPAHPDFLHRGYPAQPDFLHRGYPAQPDFLHGGFPAQPLRGSTTNYNYNMHVFSMAHMSGSTLLTKPVPVSYEKVYPPNQPMVFHPDNPNAPPIHPCGTCRKEVYDSDQAILCESGCNFWFHAVCTGLSEVAFQLLREEVYAEWVCNKCLSSKDIPFVKLKA